jgi:O-antigen ligase
MRSESSPRIPVSRASLLWFLAVELSCVTGFLVFTFLGKAGLALSFLLGPLQALAWLLVLQDSYYVLVFFAALLPLAGVEMLPQVYARYVYYPLTIALLLVTSRKYLASGAGIERTPRDKRETVPLWLLGLSLVLSTASAAAHGWTNKNLWFQVVLLAGALILLYFFATVPRTAKGIRAIIITFSVALLGTVFILRLLPSSRGEWSPLVGTITSKGGLNVFGTFLCCGASLMLGMFLESDRPSTRVATLTCMVVMLGMLVLTRSRGAWFGFGAAIVYTLLRVRSGWLWSVGALGALLFLGLGQLRDVLLSRAAETSGNDPSVLGRAVLWIYAWKVAKANWLLGVGFDNLRFVKHFYGYPEPLWWTVRFHTHNIFMEMLVDLGVFGFIGFCWVFFRTIGRLDRIVHARSPGTWGPALGLCAALVAYGAQGLFDFVAWQPGALAFLCMLLGLGISLCRIVDPAWVISERRPTSP